jgi:hypothetical protein
MILIPILFAAFVTYTVVSESSVPAQTTQQIYENGTAGRSK